MRLPEQKEIIKNCQQRAPVPVVAIAHALGLKVYQSHSLADDVSGMIKKDPAQGGSSGYAIFVNANHAEVRRRFTIAHEIAHFILHEQMIGDGVVEDALLRADGLTNGIERQANAMAADILMPWHLINESIERVPMSIEALATMFKVSRDAMSYRMLGISYDDAQAAGRA